MGFRSDRQAQLERHVESRRGRRRSVQTDARKIVERVAARAEQADDAIQSSLAAGQLYGRAR